MSEKIKCKECQFENNVKAKFCSNCGSELISQKEDEIVCKGCGFSNKIESNFCASCGNKLSRKARNEAEVRLRGGQTSRGQKGKHVKRKTERKGESHRIISKKHRRPLQGHGPIWVGALVVGFFIIYLFIDNSKQNQSNSQRSFQSTIEKKTNNIELENQVFEVASKFVCSCGSCGEEPLESCTCQTAQEERQFIRNALQQDQAIDQIITAVNMNYGWIEDEYKSKYGNGKLSLDVKSNINQNIGGELLFNEQINGQIASFTDRIKIISEFSCPCGQCDLDDLKDCNCDHPGGAKEIKQFIDDKINKGIYTLEKIVEFVEHKYGGRIR
jgi:DNA-directed RNA polymerase subunit RPC12/RpoP